MTTNHGSRIVLVRHGRTALNVEGRLRGLLDPDLDATGVAQARATAAALTPLGIGRVIASPLRRTRATAELIAEASGVDCVLDAAFVDRDYGPWTGHVQAEVVARWGSVDAAPGVEPASSVATRALRAFDAAAALTPVVIVTHDAVIRAILTSFRPEVELVVETGTWVALARDEERWHITSVNGATP